MGKKYVLYVDMDGVLVNFDKGYENLTGINIRNNFFSDESFWDPINNAGLNFWVNLEWMTDGKELWSYVKNHVPILLSAPSRKNDSRIGKHEWVKRELPGVHLILRSAKNKKEFANPNSILIDDRPDNIKSWVDSGGIGILHLSTEKTIKELKKLGL